MGVCKITEDAKKEQEQEKLQSTFIATQKPELEKIQKLIVEIVQKIKQLETEKEALGKSYNFEKDRQTLLKKMSHARFVAHFAHPFLSHYANNYVEIDLKLNEAKKEDKALNETFQNLNTKLASADVLLKNAIVKIASFNEQISTIKVK